MKLKTFACSCLLVLAALLMGRTAFSQTLTTLYQFAQPPANPDAGVVPGPDGVFYGATYYGGAFGFGTLYRITTNGVLTDLHDFDSADGAYPYGTLASDTNGSFYGSTEHGGTPGYGVIFRITTTGVFTVLTNLSPPIGANPAAPLIWGNDGALYGTAVNGGTNNDGAIFRVTTNGDLTTLFSFASTNGSSPEGPVFLATDGNFYGTTEYGGIGLGTAYSLSPTGTFTMLGSFDYVDNGGFPTGGLVEDQAGNLYGTTTLNNGLFIIPATNRAAISTVATLSGEPLSGMAPANGVFYGATSGAVYSFNPTNRTVTYLASFNGSNGSYPASPPYVEASGTLIGTASEGGTNGYGAVWELVSNSLTAIYSFQASPGAEPLGGLVQDANGVLYGSTSTGGVADNGTIFRITTNGAFQVLTELQTNGSGYPFDTLTLGSNGFLYGSTKLGGTSSITGGVVFEMLTNGAFYSNLVSFNSNNGSYPVAGVALDQNGVLYGATVNGGPYNDGTVFSLTTNGVITTLAVFNGTNGLNPMGTPVLDGSGNLWGATAGGSGATASGTIFEIPTNGIGTNVLVPFAVFNGADGSVPLGSLTLGEDGAFYGTTEFGGAHNYGVIFRVTTNGAISNLFSFNGRNGAYPATGLTSAGNGLFYGTTAGAAANGVASDGTVFSFSTNGTFTTYWAFDGTNGQAPEGPILIGEDGALYGTTAYGGAYGSGTIFRLLPGPILPTALNIVDVSNAAVLSWSNPVFTLQSSTNVDGPYATLPGSASPYTNSFTNTARFYRLVAP